MDLFATSGAILIGASISYAVYLFLKKDEVEHEVKQVEEIDFNLEDKRVADIDVDYIFTKGGKSAKQKLIQIIENSKKTVDIAIFTVTDKDIISHLCFATKRGVKVRLITDKKQTNSIKYQKDCIQKLIMNEIPVKINSHSGFMHLKLIISDNTTVATGSYNYTKAADRSNDEVVVFINNKKLATEWTKKFETMWHDSTNFTNYPYQVHQKYA